MDGQTFKRKAGVDIGYGSQQPEINKKGGIRMAKPLLNIHCIEDKYSEYPVQLKVTMDDGTVQTYNLEQKVEPHFEEAMDALDRMFACIQIGYQYEPQRQRKYRRR